MTHETELAAALEKKLSVIDFTAPLPWTKDRSHSGFFRIESGGRYVAVGMDERVADFIIDLRSQIGDILSYCRAAALTTPPQPFDGVTEVLREFVAWAARSKDVDYLNGESDIHSGDAWVHLDDLVLRAQSALHATKGNSDG